MRLVCKLKIGDRHIDDVPFHFDRLGGEDWGKLLAIREASGYLVIRALHTYGLQLVGAFLEVPGEPDKDVTKDLADACWKEYHNRMSMFIGVDTEPKKQSPKPKRKNTGKRRKS